jgi:uncharacterized membrane-anchored protein
MRKWVVWINLAVVLIAVNGMIVSKEKILRHGQTMLFQLDPVDPRSLIQGDYMALRYALRRQVPQDQLQERGFVVVRLDEHQVAQFVRIYHGGPLSEGEHLLFYKKRQELKIGAESFLFQESKAQEYRGARYAELKVSDDGRGVLAGLRGGDFAKLGEPKKPAP